MGSSLQRRETDQRSVERRPFRERHRSAFHLAAVAAAGFIAGVHVATAPMVSAERLSERGARVESSLMAKQGELGLFRLEMARLRQIIEQSTNHHIPADLAADIYEHALAQGIDPVLAFRLVEVESGFRTRAVSPKGAVGLTQVLPATAYELDPSARYTDLFDRDTNLRLGFRYLRLMLEKYDGDLRLALLAYNRGPGTVDSIQDGGGDPSNGFARRIMDPAIDGSASTRRSAPR